MALKPLIHGHKAPPPKNIKRANPPAPKKKDGDGKWLQKAEKSMLAKPKACPTCKGTVGLFTHKAKQHGMAVQPYATKVIKELKGKTTTQAQQKLLKEAVFAKNAKKASK